jgi:hypothetical protein
MCSEPSSALNALHLLDASSTIKALHTFVGPVDLSHVKSTTDPVVVDDAAFLRRFPVGEGLTPSQLERLHKAILHQQHTIPLWSKDDWDIGCAKSHVHSVELKPGTKPIRMRPYKVNQIKEDFIHAFLIKMVAAGVLKEGSSSWGFPLLLALKPGRDPKLPQSYRLLCDFRRLNDVIECPSAPLPLIDDLLRFIGEGNTWFSTQDLTQGFFACRLDHTAQQICTVVSPTGLSYQFLRLPQGLKSSPSFFSQLMVSMIQPLRLHSRVYIDDLCTATPDFDSMLEALISGWEVLASNGFKLKPEKCFYGQRRVTLLGWEITAEGRRPDPGKVQALRDMALPTTIKELYSGLGLLNFYRNMKKNK